MNAKENLLLFVAHIVRFNRLRARQDRDRLQYVRWPIIHYVMTITKHVIRITREVIKTGLHIMGTVVASIHDSEAAYLLMRPKKQSKL
ncbi:hypothetical protein [uncultured Bacteroides sp.]|uniref:hypothetical protein n=1 Tax=uncultured Bacteroides sp. TaxID=162156 RepID=UPI002AA74D53|nr:hypothetical protein [uncultured Bacteroides sp.]